MQAAWLGLDNYRDADIEVFVGTVAGVVEGGQVEVAALTDAYLAAVERAVLGNPMRPVGIPGSVVDTQALRGVTAPELWHRPAVTVWKSLADGEDLTTAVRKGSYRINELVQTNLQLAKTHAADHVMRRKAYIQGYRRVPKGASSCALCLVASTQRYRKSKLMPIHVRCDCGILPLYGAWDPGQVIEPDQLDAVHQAVADFTGIPADRGAREPTYRRFFVEHDHGEIGPVIADVGQHFTGPKPQFIP